MWGTLSYQVSQTIPRIYDNLLCISGNSYKPKVDVNELFWFKMCMHGIHPNPNPSPQQGLKCTIRTVA